MVGLHASGSMARERQKETLDALLAIPGRRRDILWAKWVGSLAKARGIALGAMAIPLVGVIAQGISPWAVAPLVLATAATVACAASFGLWLSVRSRTVQRATGAWLLLVGLWGLLLVGLWVGGTFLAAQAAYLEERANRRSLTLFEPSRPDSLLWDRALNPALAWSELTFRFREENQPRYYWTEWRDGEVEELWEILPSLLGVGLYALLAWAFYLAAAWRFERVGRG
jgi:ABC-type transport system involved in multi-copper enzyme maturation permease subunit